MFSSSSRKAAWLLQRQQQLGALKMVQMVLLCCSWYPWFISWCARATIFSPFAWMNFSVMYCAEEETCAPWAVFETHCCVVGVAPEQIGPRPIFWHLLHPGEIPDIVQGLDGRGEPSMQTEDLIFDHCGHRDVVEQIGEHGPDVLVAILFVALLVEAVDLGDPSGLVVAAGEVDAVGVPHLQGHQQRYGFHGVVAAVYEVAHEEVVGERHVASDCEQFDQIMELSVYISADGDWCFDWSGVGFLGEDGRCFFGDEFDLFFGDAFEAAQAVNNHVHFVFIAHSKYNSMLTDKEIRSFIWTELDDENPASEDEGQNLRKLKTFELKELNVQKVNVSYNFFKDLGSLNFKEFNEQSDHSIRWLDASFNFITNIDKSSQNCHILSSLRYLNVSANQIESVDFSSLQLPQLQTLNINSNRLKYFLHCPENLKVLVINDNQLTSLAFTGGSSLNILTARQNAIKNVGVSLKSLNVFDIQSNKVDDIQMMKQFLKNSQNLLSINLRENPVCKNKGYRVSVFENCPEIAQIDDILINPHIREGFKVLKAEQQLNQMLDRAYKKYEMQLAQKLKVKDELIKKIREKEKLAEQNFYKNVEEQRQQFQLLEKQAQSMLAKGKLHAPEQKDRLKTPLNEYLGQQPEAIQSKGEQLRKESLQKKHLQEYLQYLNKRRPFSKDKKRQSIIKKTSTKHISVKGIELIQPQQQVNFKDIKLFDQRSIKPLLQSYNVDMAEM